MPAAQPGRIPWIIFQQFLIVFRHLAESFSMLFYELRSVMLEPRYCICQCADFFAHNQIIIQQPYILRRIGNSCGFSMTIYISSIK